MTFVGCGWSCLRVDRRRWAGLGAALWLTACSGQEPSPVPVIGMQDGVASPPAVLDPGAGVAGSGVAAASRMGGLGGMGASMAAGSASTPPAAAVDDPAAQGLDGVSPGRSGVEPASPAMEAAPRDPCAIGADGVDPCACGNVPVPCEDGNAGPHDCRGMSLLSQLLPSAFDSRSGNDVWGYYDAERNRELAVIGLDDGTAFVDVTHPVCPEILGKLPSGVRSTLTRDVKVYQHYALVVAEASQAGMQVFDLHTLFEGRGGEPAPLTVYRGEGRETVGRAHNLAVVEGSTFVYIVASDSCGGGLHAVDMADPGAPRFAGCYSERRSMHDAQCVSYHGPDGDYVGKEICITSNGGNSISVVDMSDTGAPQLLGRVSYEGAVYSHQGWLSEDHRHFLLGDELDEDRYGHGTKTYIFDLSDLEAPRFVGAHTSEQNAIDHNLYIHRGRVFQANYTGGVRVLSSENVAAAQLEEVAFFDTVPQSDRAVMEGAWTAYPFLPSGTVISNGMNGFFALRLEPEVTAAGAEVP